MPTPLRVAIDARIPPGAWGGVQQVLEGLASGLSRLEGDDEYLFLCGDATRAWLEGRLAGPCRVVRVADGFGRTRARRSFDRLSAAGPRVAGAAQRVVRQLGPGALSVPRSDGFIESLGVDLIHFTSPQGFLTDVPSIYQPQDLLHLHYPEGMTTLRVAYRDVAYRAFCRQAAIVAVMTEWGRGDLVRAFGVPAERVAVVPWAPVTGVNGGPVGGGVPAVRDLPERFLLYPAQTWPHKNHLGLLEALARLRERDLIVPLVCTGVQNEHFPAIGRRMAELGLERQVRFLGYVAEAELAALYRSATALVFPSRFEGWGLPVVEAFAHGVPVVASNATVLPEVAGSAALFFDPDDAADMAAAIARVWVEDNLRADLVARGRSRVARLTWDRTARTFRALYRQVAGRPASDEDRALLAPPTFVR